MCINMLVHVPGAAKKHGLLPKILIKTNFMTAVPQPKAGNTISNLIHNSIVDAHALCTEKQNSYSHFIFQITTRVRLNDSCAI